MGPTFVNNSLLYDADFGIEGVKTEDHSVKDKTAILA